MALTIECITKDGQSKGTVELNPAIFATDINTDLMVQAILIRQYNARLGTRKTKARGEVRGGGRKPWRQKGTGRARHGSIRSPIWVGGGHAHPLLPGSRVRKMPKKMRRRALFSALSLKFSEGNIRLLEDLSFDIPKTKEAQSIMRTVTQEGAKTLLVTAQKDLLLQKAFRNIPGVTVLEARVLHPYDILRHEIVVFLESSLPVLEETFKVPASTS